MTLTNYWWLLIWVAVAGYLLDRTPRRRERLLGRTVERWSWGPALALAAPYILWAGYREVFGDTSLYRKMYLALEVDLSQIFPILFSDTKDPGFTVLSMILKAIFGQRDEFYFLLIAAFQMLCVVSVFRRYSQDYWMCMFLFIVSTDYLSWVHNGMRQFIAVCVIFACFDLLVKKKYGPLILAILGASLIHGSALLMIPIIFIVQGKAWNFRTMTVLVAVAACIPFVDQFTPILNDLLQNTQYDDIMTNEIWSNDDGTNLLRVLVYSAPALLSLLGRKQVRAANDPVINICVNCAVMTMLLYLMASVTSGIYVGRLPIYTTLQGYMAVPWLIDHIFEKRSAKVVRLLMCGAYLVFFYYQMHFAWAIL